MVTDTPQHPPDRLFRVAGLEASYRLGPDVCSVPQAITPQNKWDWKLLFQSHYRGSVHRGVPCSRFAHVGEGLCFELLSERERYRVAPPHLPHHVLILKSAQVVARLLRAQGQQFR